MSEPTFHFLTVVWGEAYTRLYAEVVMPTHASAGNAGAFESRKGQGDRYVIYTTRADGEVLRQSPAFAALSRQMDVRFEWLDGWFEEGVPKHAMLSRAHKHGIEQAGQEDAALVFLCPDAVWSDGTFEMLLRHVAQGKRGVMMPGVRVAIETFGPAFAERFKPDAQGVITASPRELVSVGLSHFHQISRTLRWDAPLMNPHCSHVYFPVAGAGVEVPRPVQDARGWPMPPEQPMRDEDIVGYVMRCWHLHPLMIWPERFDTRFASTVDGDFVMRACPDFDDLHVVVDSDESVVLEMSPASMAIEPRYPRAGRVLEVARWRSMFADPYHRRYARMALRLHAGRPGGWKHAQHEAEEVLQAIETAQRSDRIAKAVADLFAKFPIPRIHTSRFRGGRRTRWQHWWFQKRVWYSAHSVQWAAHLRRRWWITQHHYRTFMLRGRVLGWHKVFGVRTRLWNLRHGRGPVLLPPRPVRGEVQASTRSHQGETR